MKTNHTANRHNSAICCRKQHYLKMMNAMRNTDISSFKKTPIYTTLVKMKDLSLYHTNIDLDDSISYFSILQRELADFFGIITND